MKNYSDLFFPKLNRRKNYRTKKNGEYYADYHHYFDEIEEDCKRRCVYCDVKLIELGGEGMHLDHFRPKDIDEFKCLENDPFNLVLSCPKCNFLKKNNWPADVNSNETHINGCGFIDPFENDQKLYYEIQESGNLKPRKDPSSYLINLLKLNRMARTQIRRQRILKKEVVKIAAKVTEELCTLDGQNDISIEKYKKKINKLAEVHKLLNNILMILHKND